MPAPAATAASPATSTDTGSAPAADATTAPGGTGFRPATAPATGAVGTGRLDLNLDTNTYLRQPSLADQARTQLDADAPRDAGAPAGTRISERRGSAGAYSARVQTPLGTYCLRGQDGGSRRMSDRPADNTLLPQSCD